MVRVGLPFFCLEETFEIGMLMDDDGRYEKTQAIHGLPAPAGLQRCQRLPEPMYTPSTKAELGEHDVNISPEEAARIVGEQYASRIERLALDCYKAGAAYAEERGILIVSSSPFQ
jgi:phosphoribosylaminoimidazole-succinocarboxamide synthase